MGRIYSSYTAANLDERVGRVSFEGGFWSSVCAGFEHIGPSPSRARLDGINLNLYSRLNFHLGEVDACARDPGESRAARGRFPDSASRYREVPMLAT